MRLKPRRPALRWHVVTALDVQKMNRPLDLLRANPAHAMTREQWARIASLVEAVIALPAEARREYVERICGQDSDFRAFVDSLLERWQDDWSTSDNTVISPMALANGRFAAPRIEAVTPPTSLAGGRFQLRRRLGSGTSGVVYEAVDVLANRMVAIKLLRKVGRPSHFRPEFRTAAQVSHPNVVRLLEQFQERGRSFFTMELVEGMPIVDYVRGLRPRKVRPLTVQELDCARAVLGQLIEGVWALHAAGMLHGDLKPANVLVSDQGHLVLVDLSLAGDLRLSLSQQPKFPGGTPIYMAPELLSDTTLTEAADWYSVGVMMYELLTGRVPFDGSWLQIFSQKGHDDVVLPDDLDRREPLAMLCADLLQRNPHARPTGVEIRERFARLV